MTLREPEPHEAQQMMRQFDWSQFSSETEAAFKHLMTAVNGFPYPGLVNEGLLAAIIWLKENPEHVKALFPETPPTNPYSQKPCCRRCRGAVEDCPDCYGTGHTCGQVT